MGIGIAAYPIAFQVLVPRKLRNHSHNPKAHAKIQIRPIPSDHNSDVIAVSIP